MDAGKNGDFDIATPISLQRFHKSNHRSHPSYFELNTYDVTSDVSQIRERKTAPSPINPHPKPPPNPLQQRAITHRRTKNDPISRGKEEPTEITSSSTRRSEKNTDLSPDREGRSRGSGRSTLGGGSPERRGTAPARGRIGRGGIAQWEGGGGTGRRNLCVSSWWCSGARFGWSEDSERGRIY